MKIAILLSVLLCAYQCSAYSIFCYEGSRLTGRYVYFTYPSVDGAYGCCVGGARSVLIIDSYGYYVWYNCPSSVTTTTLPLVCHSNAICDGTGEDTENTGASGVDECCSNSGGYDSSFKLRGYDVCFQCSAPTNHQPVAVPQNVPENVTMSYSIFCYEGSRLTGRYVYFTYPSANGAYGCCVGGAQSVLIIDSYGYYVWYNCPSSATTITLPLNCHPDAKCRDAGKITSTFGASAVDECCSDSDGYYSSYNLVGGDVCFQCSAPTNDQPVAVPQNVAENVTMSVNNSDSYSIFCYEGSRLTGRYVYFTYLTANGAEGCCVGGAQSVLIIDSYGYYYWYNCPSSATTITLPLNCHPDAKCSVAGKITSTFGASAIDECCSDSGGYFNLVGGDVCFQCLAPTNDQPVAVPQNVPENIRMPVQNSDASANIASIGILIGGLIALFGI